jgi:hypothetical protein
LTFHILFLVQVFLPGFPPGLPFLSGSTFPIPLFWRPCSFLFLIFSLPIPFLSLISTHFVSLMSLKFFIIPSSFLFSSFVLSFSFCISFSHLNPSEFISVPSFFLHNCHFPDIPVLDDEGGSVVSCFISIFSHTHFLMLLVSFCIFSHHLKYVFRSLWYISSLYLQTEIQFSLWGSFFSSTSHPALLPITNFTNFQYII